MRDRIAAAFEAATADLSPRGKLPAGMTEAKATRAILAQIAILLDGDDDQGDDDDDDTGEPILPAAFPGGMSPDQVGELIGQQDRELCRRFGAALLRHCAGWDNSVRIGIVDELARDLEAGEVSALELVATLHGEITRPRLIKAAAPDPEGGEDGPQS